MGRYAESAARYEELAKRLQAEMPEVAAIARRAADIVRDADKH